MVVLYYKYLWWWPQMVIVVTITFVCHQCQFVMIQPLPIHSIWFGCQPIQLHRIQAGQMDTRVLFCVLNLHLLTLSYNILNHKGKRGTFASSNQFILIGNQEYMKPIQATPGEGQWHLRATRDAIVIHLPKLRIKPRTVSQQCYLVHHHVTCLELKILYIINTLECNFFKM